MWNLNMPDKSDSMGDIDKAFNFTSGKIKHVISVMEKAAVQAVYLEYERLRGTPNEILKALTLREDLRTAF